MSEDRWQRTENRGQIKDDSGDMLMLSFFLSSVLCLLISDLCLLTSDI
jgi:hypothetical protein